MGCGCSSSATMVYKITWPTEDGVGVAYASDISVARRVREVNTPPDRSTIPVVSAIGNPQIPDGAAVYTSVADVPSPAPAG